MKTTLLITTYNRPDALELCLMSVLRQTHLPDEILIADDGSTADTKELIDTYRTKFSIPVIHIWHEDKGFRRTVILNRAFLVAKGDYIIQVDGDLILGRHFIADHINFAKEKCIAKGRRVCLSQKETDRLLKEKSLKASIFLQGTTMREHGIRIPLYNQLFSPKEKATGDGVGGGNMAYWKADALAINGYNMDIQGWGPEDWEFAQRLVHFGCKQRKLKFGAIQFHLEHNTYPKQPTEDHLRMVEELKKNKNIRCTNGVEQINNLIEQVKIYE